MKRKALKKKPSTFTYPKTDDLSTYDSHVGVSTFDSCAMMDDGNWDDRTTQSLRRETRRAQSLLEVLKVLEGVETLLERNGLN